MYACNNATNNPNKLSAVAPSTLAGMTAYQANDVALAAMKAIITASTTWPAKTLRWPASTSCQ